MIEASSTVCDMVQRQAMTVALVALLDHIGVGEGNLTTFEGLEIKTFDGDHLVTFDYADS